MKALKDFLTPQALTVWQGIVNDPINDGVTQKQLISRLIVSRGAGYTPYNREESGVYIPTVSTQTRASVTPTAPKPAPQPNSTITPSFDRDATPEQKKAYLSAEFGGD